MSVLTSNKRKEIELLYAITLTKLLRKWTKWSLKTGYSLTFSTFVNDFKVEKFVPVDLYNASITNKHLYNSLKNMIKAADQEAESVFKQ